MTKIEELDLQAQRIVRQAGKNAYEKMDNGYQVDTKTNYTDLVTTIDRENEQFINQQLRKIDPNSRILSEEGFGDKRILDLTGHIWIVDPIDGTMNFVKQHNNFAVMLALYIDGIPTLGYIVDVVNNHLYHGRHGEGVFKDDQQLTPPANLGLRESLLAMNRTLTLGDNPLLKRVAKEAMGLRMYGSAGIEMIGVLTGQLGGYISNLKPWDLAAGRMLAEELGLVVKSIDGSSINVLSSNLVLVATSQVSRDIRQIIN
ncbi:inositol monophosphatase family protein [Limosilactobacillus sp. STM2_1]|uniref:Inositol monophosphatase family protein n=1 Tax=Limosilactobacillus rudii TaxID=2759755 RepID=A0A7W3UKK7_9LACO|nr:inositol monophosphatase family protein [Limosilactobacillus rudii]MBB1078581.1 inositol monophosphatase family protein [Limosilactobacillus rudii]MBB1097221.1 inositol monophosphatase family protein [Limosilactobacillus rudii]MCD7133863.1 inositol monophosphatase family protein [Limosilactobacillus rudii]